ncbi:LysM domain-containing protein [Labedella populi]|uniref:LysM domain-containing protein n=1 Tax=Labedella populi TaxID=2498850 RepID=A0A3S4AJJ4_9MICO|nr:LysM domain-containing protein [Labedella populi]RWZ61500.1 LysM domain-containing protein [Labedella populi]
MAVIRKTSMGIPLALVAALATAFQPGSAATADVRTSPEPLDGHRSLPAQPPAAPQPASVPAAATVPTTYTVASGDTVSGIAARFGLDVKAVLAANGLGWSSVIYPGQSLVLSTGSDAAPSLAPAPAPAPNAAERSYTVVAGDTLIGIAKAHGTTVSSILAANGLTRSSIIYPGQIIAIPGGEAAAPAPTPAPARAPAPAGSDATTPLTAEMHANAALIVAIGRSLGVSDQGLVIALAAAMQESGLRNLDHGHADSVGIFQQRPSQGWGSPEQIQDATYSSTAFFVGVTGKTRGLLDISGWQDMSVTDAAQAVQISAYPDAYARWEQSARVWLSEL